MENFRTFSEEEWAETSKSVRDAFENLEIKYIELFKRHEKLEIKSNKTSRNSSKPPSTDNPFTKSKPKEDESPAPEKKKSGARKGHQGHRQKMLEPTESFDLKPELCCCGNTSFPLTERYYTHQEIELPEIQMDVLHFHLHKAQCPVCGEINKAHLPPEHRSGYGPRVSALIAEIAGGHGNSRSSVQQFCQSVLRFPISIGAIQKVIDRVSEAIKPHYDHIAEKVRRAQSANIDETSHPKNGRLSWLWVMATSFAALFMIHANRSKEAFEQLVRDWAGILISDGYAVYRKWVGKRQTCLAHLIRDARGLSERLDPEIARFGKWALAELRRLCEMAKSPPQQGHWNAFYARLIRLITLHRDRQDDAGIFARRLQRELDSLWVFLEQEGVSPTNNHAERMLRFAVTWRKRSQGTASEKGERWVERILTLRHTCHLQNLKTFPILVSAMRAYFKDQKPDLEGIIK